MEKENNYYAKGIYKGDEFPDEIGNEIMISNDNENGGYIIKFPCGAEFDNMHDEDIQFKDYE